MTKREKLANPFGEELPEIDPAVFARIDARLEAARNDPNFEPPKVAWLEDPDPFGSNWDWLYGTPDRAASDLSGNGGSR